MTNPSCPKAFTRLVLGLLLALAAWPGRAGELAIIIDDVGYSAPLGEQSLALPGAFTYAVLPRSPQGPRLARQAAEQGKEVMVHAPMSNTRDLPLDPGALSGDMPHRDFQLTLAHNLRALPQARGLNNHMGSQLTQEPGPMGWLMQSLGEQGYYFIDSRTTAQSRAWETARHYGVPTLQRDVFLDHERDPKQIARQLREAITLARDRGYALAIGHPYPETLTVLADIDQALENAGVELVPVSTLLRHPALRPRAYRGACLAPPMTLWRRPAALSPPTAPPLRWLERALNPVNPTGIFRVSQHLR